VDFANRQQHKYVGSKLNGSKFDMKRNRCKVSREVGFVYCLLVITLVHNTMKLQTIISVTIKLSSQPLIKQYC